MGTGKTAVARRLARSLKMEYVSTDDIIENREGRPINEIFTKDGETYFRGLEREAVKKASLMNNAVVAAGGGAVLDSGNMENLKRRGVVICLNAAPEDILERTKGYTDRPLLNVPDPMAKIKELLEKRAPYYKKADYQIDTSGKTLDEVTEEVKGLIAKL